MNDWLLGAVLVLGLVIGYFAIGWVTAPFRKGRGAADLRQMPNPLLIAAESPRMFDALLPARAACERQGLSIRLVSGSPKRLLRMLEKKTPGMVFLAERPQGKLKGWFLPLPICLNGEQREGFFAVWNSDADCLAMEILRTELKKL